MKLKKQVVIEGNVAIPHETITLVGYRHQSKLIARAKVLGNFDCFQTNITSLEQGPSHVGDYFSCSATKITSLKQGPSYVGGGFSCSATKITSLEGGPSYVGGNFYCGNTKITSLHNIHKEIKYIGRMLSLSNTIKSHILGVMFIKGLQRIEFHLGNIEQKQVERIINKHLAGDRNIHLAQEELIEAGLVEFAKL